MKLYQSVDVSELEDAHFYTIHGIHKCGYLCGQFGHKTVQDDGSIILTFFGTLYVDYRDENPSRFLLPVEYFYGSRGLKMRYVWGNDTKIFKRVIYEEEQRNAHRRAFEKRAVEQIVSTVLGHPFKYY